MSSYTVEILGFPSVPAEEAIKGLDRAFGIPSEQAATIVESAPVIVKRDCTAEETQRYIKALLHIGADVQVHNGDNARTYRTQVRSLEAGSSPRQTPSASRATHLDDEGHFATAAGFEPGRILREASARFDARPSKVGSPEPRSAAAVPSAATQALGASLQTPMAEPSSTFRRAPLRAETKKKPTFVWSEFPDALAYLVRGGGKFWLLWVGGLGLAFTAGLFIQAFTFGFVKLFLLAGILLMWAGLLSMQRRYFAYCQWGGAAEDTDGPPPPTDMNDFKTEYALPGLMLLVAWGGLNLPLIILVAKRIEKFGGWGIFDYLTSPLPIALFLLPYLYWPMALGLIAAKGSVAEIANAPGVIRGAFVGGFEYLFIAVLGLFSPAFLVFAPGVIAQFLPPFLVLPIVVVFIFGVTAGIQGYLMGALYRRRPTIFQ